jgi:cellulose synthase/poly-beta-1,6-N-acetylglucosamine synthase-like glycosyltransferase
MGIEWFGVGLLGLCVVLLLYHHLAYPYLLRRLAARRPLQQPRIPQRGWHPAPADAQLAEIVVLMPAYNEARFLAEKLRNLAQLDYPAERWQLRVLLDGCSDDSAHIVRQVLAEPELQGLPVVLCEYPQNRGKIYRINQAMAQVQAGLVLFTDVSALLPVDTLLALDAHFAEPQVGAVSLGYRLLHPGSSSELSYWQYQSQIKSQESRLGCLQGAHGSAWAMRRQLFAPLPADTINDDFILPMQVAQQGYRVVYEARLQALELESIAADAEQLRRRRIGAGNAQQAWRLRGLLRPRQGLLAFMFASGKVLRVLMPFCLLLILLCSVWLGLHNPWFAALALLQVAAYGALVTCHLAGIPLRPRVLQLVDYLICGHWANFIGSLRYISGVQAGVWQRVTEVKS